MWEHVRENCLVTIVNLYSTIYILIRSALQTFRPLSNNNSSKYTLQITLTVDVKLPDVKFSKQAIMPLQLINNNVPGHVIGYVFISSLSFFQNLQNKY